MMRRLWRISWREPRSGHNNRHAGRWVYRNRTGRSPVRPLLSKIPFKTAGTQTRPRHAPLNRLIHCIRTDTAAARLEDAIAQRDLVILVEPGGR